MNEEKLQNIRKTLIKSRSKLHKTFVFTAFFILLFGISAVFKSTSKTEISCYISPQQKSILKQRISSIASTQKVSEYSLFRHLKGALKYETIGKMPCAQYTEALEHLSKIERQITQ